MNYLDLFSGCGGFRRGLEEAGYAIEWEGHSEIDKPAKSIYESHYSKSEDLGDVREIKIRYSNNDKREIGKSKARLQPDRNSVRGPGHNDDFGQRSEPNDSNQCSNTETATTITTPNGAFTLNGKINLITFGFPCQDLSIAGKRGGLKASRSGLFFEAMRIVRDAGPDYFIFENVKGLFSSRGGLDWLNVLREIADSGYIGQWQLLNTRWFLPQNRERIYFVGYPRKRSRPKIFPIGESGKAADNSNGLIQIGNIDTKGHNSIWGRVYDPDGAAVTLNSEGGGMGAKTGLYEIPEATKKGYAIAEEGDSINLSVLDSKTRRGRVRKGEANTLDTGQQQYTIQPKKDNGVAIKLGNSNMKGPRFKKDAAFTVEARGQATQTQTGIRRLTPIECERLQGFPDEWTAGQSDTQRYKMLGNAVSVPVVKAVVERLMEIEN